MAGLIRAFDWTATPLGAAESWPQCLRTVVDLILASPVANVLVCGPARVLIYNDAFIPLYGAKHPRALGAEGRRAFPELWAEIGPLYDRVFAGEALSFKAQPWTFERGAAPSDGLYDAYFTPGRGEDGAVLFAHVAAVEVTDRARTEAVLRESEERFRSFAEASQEAMWIIDAASGRLEYLSPAFETIWGESRDRVLADVGRWAELLHPDDRAQALTGMPRLMAGETFQQSYRIVRPGTGEVRWVLDTGFSIRDDDGRVVRVGGIAQDVTERVAAVRALQASEEWLSLAIDVASLGAWDWDVTTGRVAWSADHFGINGYEVDEVEPSYEAWASRVHPDDLPGAEAALAAARDGDGRYAHDFRTLWPDGAVRWCSAVGRFYYDEGGRPIRMVGVVEDVTDQHDFVERQRLLLEELQHRVRNTLSVVRSVARRTAEVSDTVEGFAQHLDGRLSAFARVQALVTRDPMAGVDLQYLLAEELRAHGAQEGEGVSVDGPSVLLAARPAQTLALAIHELATNALKYGALSHASGRLKVCWTLSRDVLAIRWRETGAPQPIAPPERKGFGSELLEQTLSYELQAEVRLDYRPEGLSAGIDLPVTPKLLVRSPANGS